MAEKLCELRKKGGGGGATYTETVLWTNPSPSSDFVADTTVTLSQGMSNFKYIKITWARTTSELSNVGSAIYPVEDFVRYTWGTMNPTANIGITNTSNAPFARTVIYVSDTKIRFGINARINYANTTNTGNIPLEILGLNELAQGTVQTATGTCERGASAVTVNLGFRPSFVSLYKTNASSSGTSAGDSLFVADTGFSTSYVLSAYKESSGSTFTKVAMNNYITITDTGFTFASSSTSTFRGTYRYVAIGSTTE